MNAHGIQAVGQETLTRAPLIVAVDNANPEQDPAGLNRILEVSGVSGNEPKTKSMLEVRGAGVEASLQAVGQGTSRASNQLRAVGKRQCLNAQGLLFRRYDGFA